MGVQGGNCGDLDTCAKSCCEAEATSAPTTTTVAPTTTTTVAPTTTTTEPTTTTTEPTTTTTAAPTTTPEPMTTTPGNCDVPDTWPADLCQSVLDLGNCDEPVGVECPFT